MNPHLNRIAQSALLALLVGSAAHAAPTGDTTRVIVRYDSTAARQAASAKSQLATAGAKVKVDLPHLSAVAVTVPAANVQALQRMAGVKSVEIDPPRTLQAFSDRPSDGKQYAKGQRVPYGIKMVQADQMPQGDAFAGNTKICIVDSGFDVNHPDLQGISVTGTDNKLNGKWNVDELGHGSHIAGTIAAVNNVGEGVVGVLPNKKVSLHIEKIYSGGSAAAARGARASKPPVPAFASDVAAALKRCQTAGAKVYSLSIAGDTKSQAEEDTFNEIYAAGGLFLVSMGNQGTRELWYPAGYAVSIGVGAVDANKKWAYFSQYPSNGKVELAAPGVDVLSIYSTTSDGWGGKPATTSLTAGGKKVHARFANGSKLNTPVTAPMADFKDGQWEDPAMAGKICLITHNAYDGGVWDAPAQRCQKSGGVGFVFILDAKVVDWSVGVINNSGGLIPGGVVGPRAGRELLAHVGTEATIVNKAWSYDYESGTSFAAPHAAAAAALLWSYFPNCTNEEIRKALQMGAEDVNAPGRDIYTGFGVVRTRASHDYLKTHACAADRQAAAPAKPRVE